MQTHVELVIYSFLRMRSLAVQYKCIAFITLEQGT